MSLQIVTNYLSGSVRIMQFMQGVEAASDGDDHRYYHHNRINQSPASFSSATCFSWRLYLFLFVHPIVAAFLWLGYWPMVSRQIVTSFSNRRVRRSQQGDP